MIEYWIEGGKTHDDYLRAWIGYNIANRIVILQKPGESDRQFNERVERIVRMMNGAEE